MNKLIITTWKSHIVTASIRNNKVMQIQLESQEQTSLLNNIYIGKVKNIVKNINSAFIELGDGQMAYYNLTENPVHHFTTGGPNCNLKAGDEIIVQVSKDPVKSKDPVVTSNLNFTGQYCVLTSSKTMLGFSSKITDKLWKEAVKADLQPYLGTDFGVIIRTNARHADTSQIISELSTLKQRYQTLLTNAAYRSCYTLLYQEPRYYMTIIRDIYHTDLDAIVTDDPDIFAALIDYAKDDQLQLKDQIQLYQDPFISLANQYNLEREIAHALDKKVWLKSGGYLIIEPTEAMVVIDVNTGKYAGKKNVSETIFKINLEAAEMIAHQLRLRNLSGIIIIDFIDMENKEQQQALLSRLRELVAEDPVKTTVAGITALNLVELTRKKTRRPLYEQLSQ